ncbi:unnamed protein product [Vitrella brassicaformis CCMP3155]|uniref:GH16 domain-containing protein n=1 Tax=Vitrella brassicaformis (strain CCMP3155) TaxID=1169540 RepID=A0A0G4FEA1_VITBC|nr:unnamed protein product [Vitrella brassicaformis CCMP3155]|eukprot:CEM11536.1 unnamed protein product [Vitrella brassicaformis CCMP3155]
MKRGHLLHSNVTVLALVTLTSFVQQRGLCIADSDTGAPGDAISCDLRSGTCDPLIGRRHNASVSFQVSHDTGVCRCPGAGGSCYGDCGRKFDAAEVATVETFKYGRFETRLFPDLRANGTLVAFFLYKNDSDKVPGTSWTEIDFEVHGMGKHSAEPIQTNIVTGNMGRRTLSEMFLAAPRHRKNMNAQMKAIKDSFHHFAIEWTPSYVSWYFDGHRLRHEVSCDARGADAEECSPQVARLNKAMNLRMSVWPLDPSMPWAEHWAGIFDRKNAKLPLTVYYDYVRVYDYEPFSKGFTLRWTDDFSGLNTSRWTASTHTFLGNEAHFRPERAVIAGSNATDANGYLTLSISRAEDDIAISAPQDSESYSKKFLPAVRREYRMPCIFSAPS